MNKINRVWGKKQEKLSRICGFHYKSSEGVASYAEGCIPLEKGTNRDFTLLLAFQCNSDANFGEC